MTRYKFPSFREFLRDCLLFRSNYHGMKTLGIFTWLLVALTVLWIAGIALIISYVV